LHAVGVQETSGFAVIEQSIVQQSCVLATNDLFWLWGWVVLALIGVVWVARPPFIAGGAHLAGE
jgi:MFS transporter, DHA2 family, multidrug resistance protein